MREGEKGKGSVSVRALPRKPGVGGLGCLHERVDAGRCPRWSASWQPQVAKNLADHCGIFNGREDGQGIKDKRIKGSSIKGSR